MKSAMCYDTMDNTFNMEVYTADGAKHWYRTLKGFSDYPMNLIMLYLSEIQEERE